jgi:P-type Cu+ transporter
MVLSSCCDHPVDRSEAAEKKAYKALMRKSIVAIVIGAVYFMGPYFQLFPGFFTTDGQVFWWLSAVIVAATILYAGRQFYVGAWHAFFNHTANMDTLVTVGTFAAWVYSVIVTAFGAHLPQAARGVYFDTATLVIGFVVLGSAMEMRARSNTNAAISHLMALAPETAMVIRDGDDVWVSIEDLVVGDVVRLRPGDKVPVDGIVTEGLSTVDEAMLTGEPLAVSKSKDDELMSGTVNQKGTLLYRATHVGADTALANIISTVKKAQRSKPEIGRLTDKIASVFAPAVLIFALITAIIWMNFGPAPIAAHVLMTSIAVLLIACPCALGLATPISIMIAVGKAAQNGIIIRNGEALQTARKLTTIVLDKTGTITEGKPDLTDCFIQGEFTEADVLQCVASVEANSEHPLAMAIVTHATAKNIEKKAVINFESLSGRGACAQVDGRQVIIGNARLMEDIEVSLSSVSEALDTMVSAAKTPIFVVIDGVFAALMAVSDPIKEDSKAMILRLKKLKLRVMMLTGDNKTTALAVARAVGIDEADVVAEVLPQDKADVIEAQVYAGQTVAMVGDGINDAAALARSHVGFAIGSGTDIAIESADMVLISGSLDGVVKAIMLSRTTMRNIKQNLLGAFLYNICGIPIAAGILFPFFGVLLSPIIAGIAMAASSLTVVMNANRLRLIKMD